MDRYQCAVLAVLLGADLALALAVMFGGVRDVAVDAGPVVV